MNKSEMISKKATLETLFRLVKWSRLADKESETYMNGFRDAFEDCYTAVELMQTVETERKTGKWIPENTSGPYYCQTFVCSECGEITRITVMGEPRHRYCPHCGVKMCQE